MSAEPPGNLPASRPSHCNQCGAELTPYTFECPTCQIDLVNGGMPPVADGVLSRATEPKPVPGPGYHIVSLMLTIPLIAVFFGLYRDDAFNATVYAVVVLPVFLLTLARVWDRRGEGRPMLVVEKIYFFMKMSFLVVIGLAAVAASLVISLYLICTMT